VIPEWLEHIVHFFGSEVHYRCKVKQIITSGDHCTGILLEHRGAEQEISCRYVVAACDAGALYEKMLPACNAKTALGKKMADAELYSSSVTVSIALDCPAADLGFNEELIHLSSAGISRAEHSGGDPQKTEISILAPSFRDHTLAPEGQGTLMLFMPAFMHYKDEWLTEKDEEGNYIRGEAYKQLKKEIAETLIDRVENAIAPGLRAHILFYDVATPVTHYRYTGNKNGTMMGAKPCRKNMQSGVARYATPFKNLYLSGHWAELGGGVPIAVKAAANTCLMIFRKDNPEAFQLLAGYMDGKTSLPELLNSNSFLPYRASWKQKPTPAQKLARKTDF
jgi:phytoene dehydrogenase-like protein